MRTNMYSNIMGGGYGNSSSSGSGGGYGGCSGNLNGVSGILNDKSSNPGVEDLMRDLKEAKVGFLLTLLTSYSSLMHHITHHTRSPAFMCYLSKAREPIMLILRLDKISLP
jgi:hypothetical protein